MAETVLVIWARVFLLRMRSPHGREPTAAIPPAVAMIRNYLGFPRGVGGGELAHRAWQQAVLFGAQFVFIQESTGLKADGVHRLVTLSGGSQAVARAVIIATGVTYRRLGIPALDRLVGMGVFYGAAGSEAPAMADQEVYVIGEANSAGQAALPLCAVYWLGVLGTKSKYAATTEGKMEGRDDHLRAVGVPHQH
jgi:thioredoxin reductase